MSTTDQSNLKTGQSLTVLSKLTWTMCLVASFSHAQKLRTPGMKLKLGFEAYHHRILRMFVFSTLHLKVSISVYVSIVLILALGFNKGPHISQLYISYLIELSSIIKASLV